MPADIQFLSYKMQEDSRVVLLSNRSLLSVSVAMLLQEAEGIELTIVAADDQEAVSNIKQRTPQFIIIDSGDAFVDERLIIRLLEEYPQVRIITLNVNHEIIKIYQMQHLIQTDINGLLETIRSGGSPPDQSEGVTHGSRSCKS